MCQLYVKGTTKLECAASNGNRYPPYPQVMATAISQQWLLPSFEKKKQKKKLEWAASNGNRYPPYPQVMATAISQ